MGRPLRNGYYSGNGNGHGFNLATIVQVMAIPIITGTIVVAGQYYVTKDELARHEVAVSSTIPNQIKAEADAREKSRGEFLDKLQHLNDGVAALNTNLAVQTQRNDQIVDTLKQIRDQIAATRR